MSLLCRISTGNIECLGHARLNKPFTDRDRGLNYMPSWVPPCPTNTQLHSSLNNNGSELSYDGTSPPIVVHPKHEYKDEVPTSDN